MGEGTDQALTPERALDVLLTLEPQLRDVDGDRRAIVGLAAHGGGQVALVDVDLDDDGVLDAAGADALVVVTSEEVTDDEDDVACITQLVCVLPTGTEVGISRADGAQDASVWRTDRHPEDAAHDLRPRDVASNTARRAFGLPSHIPQRPSMDELLGRVWLVGVASEALRRFDGPDGVRDVEVEELADVAAEPLFDGLAPADGPVPTWEELHAHATAGDLHVGPFRVAARHAAWLDVDGFAQALDTTLPPVEDLLDQLRIVSDGDATHWALNVLLDRGWHPEA